MRKHLSLAKLVASTSLIGGFLGLMLVQIHLALVVVLELLAAADHQAPQGCCVGLARSL